MVPLIGLYMLSVLGCDYDDSNNISVSVCSSDVYMVRFVLLSIFNFSNIIKNKKNKEKSF